VKFDLPPDEKEYVTDGDKFYEIDTVMLAKTSTPEGLPQSVNSTLSGPDPTFALAENVSIYNLARPVAAITVIPPAFCAEALILTCADLLKEEDEVEEELEELPLEDVGEKARMLNGAELETKKNLARHVLTKLHSAQKMYTAYSQQKHRLQRTAFLGYSVAAVLALVLLFAGAVRHSLSTRKWEAVSPHDEEAVATN
jgi:hypothetical protein